MAISDLDRSAQLNCKPIPSLKGWRKAVIVVKGLVTVMFLPLFVEILKIFFSGQAIPLYPVRWSRILLAAGLGLVCFSVAKRIYRRKYSPEVIMKITEQEGSVSEKLKKGLKSVLEGAFQTGFLGLVAFGIIPSFLDSFSRCFFLIFGFMLWRGALRCLGQAWQKLEPMTQIR